MTHSTTVDGKTYEVPVPYSEGHKLNAVEATVLNQTFAENVINNTRSAIRDAVENGGDPQAVISDYASDYTFSAGRGTRGNPLAAECRKIAAGMIKRALAQKGLSMKEYGQDAYKAKVAELVDDEKVVERARINIALEADL